MSDRKILYNIEGEKFNKLTVLRLAGVGKHGQRMWECECECGNIVKVNQYSILKGMTQSCGCKRLDSAKNRNCKHGLTKGHKFPDGYKVWSSMRDRCFNPNNPSYHNYGGRGITVCDRWNNSFTDFISDMGERQNKTFTIDRINVNGNYEPNNCKWATRHEQGRNRRNNIWITYNGETLVLSDWAKKINISPQHLRAKLKRKHISDLIK